MENTNHVMADANESVERNVTRNESKIFASYGLVGAILVCRSWLSARSLVGQQPMAVTWWIADRPGRRLSRIAESSETAVTLAAVQCPQSSSRSTLLRLARSA